MPTFRDTDQLQIAAVCLVGALVSAVLVPLALLLFALVPPLGVVLLGIIASLAPALLCTSIGFLIRWVLQGERRPTRSVGVGVGPPPA